MSTDSKTRTITFNRKKPVKKSGISTRQAQSPVPSVVSNEDDEHVNVAMSKLIKFKTRSNNTNLAHLEALQAFEQPPLDVLLLGDSFFERLLLSNHGLSPSGAWESLLGGGHDEKDVKASPALGLGQELGWIHNPLCNRAKVFNAGVGGDKASNALWRLTEGNFLDSLESKGGTKAVIICLGINDYVGNESEPKQTLQRTVMKTLLTTLRSHEATRTAQLVVLAIPPRTKRPTAMTNRSLTLFLFLSLSMYVYR